MRLFPTVHATGDLPPAHRAHLERHGLTFVGADDDPDVVLVLPGTAPGRRRRAAPASSSLATGRRAPEVAAPARRPRDHRARRRRRRPTGLVPADLTADDLLAWTTDVGLPVRATLDVDGPAAPLLRTATGSQALGLTVVAGVRDGRRRGCWRWASTRSTRPEVLLNAVIWAARPTPLRSRPTTGPTSRRTPRGRG